MPMKKNHFSDFSEMTLHGMEENLQKIPRSYAPSSRRGYFALEAFENDMAAYARRSYPRDAAAPSPATFIHFRPTYQDMSPAQRSWYLYWRGQARRGDYLDTDYPYIQLFATELISGYGWETPEDGYLQLLELWQTYRGRYNTMDKCFPGWSFDFAMEYDLEYRVIEALGCPVPVSQEQQNMILSQRTGDNPLRLSYEMILTLSDYNPANSGFWKEGNEDLMRKAIPRVISLCDILIRKDTGRGLLQSLGPQRPRVISYTPYEGTFCQKSASASDIPLIDYTGGRTLTHFVTELIRTTENILREITGFRGKLRDVDFEPRMRTVVEQFLRKEYGPKPVVQDNTPKISLDISKIKQLREESDAVRDALNVEDEEVTEDEKPKVTPAVTVPPVVPPKTENIASYKSWQELFTEENLAGEYRQIFEALSPALVAVIHALLTDPSPADKVNELAKKENTMPRPLIDRINETAMECMDDILIEMTDGVPCILDFYKPELLAAVR